VLGRHDAVQTVLQSGEHVDQVLLLRVRRLILFLEIADEDLERFQLFGRERKDLGRQAVAGGVERRPLLASSVRGPVDFCAFRRLARSRASDGARRMGSGEFGGASTGRDGSLAGRFFLVAMKILCL
jgi:hypothetical protein